MRTTKVFKTMDNDNCYHLWNYNTKKHIVKTENEKQLLEWLVEHPEYILIN